MSTQSVICVVGNPNCGKTTLFNVLTGRKQTVGNWPGVTVEKKVGSYRYQQQQVTLVDLPGVYSLNPSPRVRKMSGWHAITSCPVKPTWC
ncbi:50S ribosome-binding GTPase [Dickeya fangzhongdai]|uniref:FeoB small GTPase domain-containing protein n=1 Tax=Dickeya fangzhongdai TaxID=1778540 RepID=UPI001EFB23EC|nr:FeoB small GTPase domain-containing protein [Dickeya fangzhongdai]ULR29318.1 50S ribosome-binding GTPase [Dickeya fangzhongdai]